MLRPSRLSRGPGTSVSCSLVAVLLTLGSLIAPSAGEAQAPRKVYRIGLLDVVPIASNAANLDSFRQGLRELGYVEEQDFIIEYRSADGRAERFPALPASLFGSRLT